MKFQCEFDMDNAAFEHNCLETSSEIIKEVSVRLHEGADTGIIRDYNGNTVGQWEVTDKSTLIFQCPDCEQIFDVTEDTETCPHCGEGLLLEDEDGDSIFD